MLKYIKILTANSKSPWSSMSFCSQELSLRLRGKINCTEIGYKRKSMIRLGQQLRRKYCKTSRLSLKRCFSYVLLSKRSKKIRLEIFCKRASSTITFTWYSTSSTWSGRALCVKKVNEGIKFTNCDSCTAESHEILKTVLSITKWYIFQEGR